jgi:ABC-type amino acid transport substrate-binding protein
VALFAADVFNFEARLALAAHRADAMTVDSPVGRLGLA